MHFDGNQEDTIGYTVGCVNNIARFSHYLHLNITKFIYRMAGGGAGGKGPRSMGNETSFISS